MHLHKYFAILLLIIFHSFSVQAIANTSAQDSIQKFDKETFQASLKELAPKEFSRLFRQHYIEDSLKRALGIIHIKKSMLSSDDLEAQFWGYVCLANWERNKMNLKASIAYLSSAFTIAKTVNNEDMIMSSLMNTGVYYYDFGFYNEAMEYYLQVLKIAKKSDSKARQLAVMQNIALLKLEVNDRKGAIELLEESLKIVENEKVFNFDFVHVNIYIALAKAYIGIEDYEKAEVYCNKGIELSKKYKDEGANVYFYNFLGGIANANGNYEKAHEILDKAEEIATRIESTQAQLPFIELDRAKAYYFQKKYNIAIETLLAIEKTQKLNSTDFIFLEEIYALLAKSYKEIDDTESSLKYYEKSNEVYKKNDKRQENISVDIIKKYDLRTLKEELDKSQESSKRTEYILYISITLTILIIVGLIYFYKKREKDNQRKFAIILKNLEEEKEEIVASDIEVDKKVVTEVGEIKTVEVKETETKEIEIIDETKERLLKKLQNFETKELYLSKNSSLNDVAKKLKTNTSYLSKLVNAHKGKSFTAYITDLRVNYAIKRLKNDKKFRSYTIDSIAQEIGFNRSESFSRAFKNKTGLYPSYYIKNLDNQNIE